MKAGWKVKTLGEVCTVLADGDWIESKDQAPDGIRLIQTGNVGEGVFKDRGEKARYISESTFKRLRCTEIFEGDCLISRLPDPVGRSCLLPDTGERMITAVDCAIVRFNQKWVIPTFFNYYSQSLDYLKAVESETTGTTRKRISRNKLGLITIPIPPLAEQQRIVAILDQAFAAIATAKAHAAQNLQNARALFESYLQAVFTQRGEGWEEKRLGEICELISGQHIEAKDYNTNSIGVAYLTGPSDFGFINPIITKWTEYPKRMAQRGDILITVKGAGVGKINQLNIEEVAISRQLMAVRTSAIYRDYIYAFLSTKLEYFQSLSKGATIPGVSRPDILDLICPIPPSEMKQNIVDAIHGMSESTQRLENIYERKLAALDALKKSLLHQAFSGELGTSNEELGMKNEELGMKNEAMTVDEEQMTHDQGQMTSDNEPLTHDQGQLTKTGQWVMF